MLKFVVKDYDLLKKHFYEHIWGLLSDDNHQIIKREDIPADRTQVDTKYIDKLTDDRRPDITFLLKMVAQLDAALAAGVDKRGVRVTKAACARMLTGALIIIDSLIVSSYRVRDPNNSYWHRNTSLITGESEPHPADATVKNALDDESKIALVNQACAFLSGEIYDTVNGQKKLRAVHEFNIPGFHCTTYLVRGAKLALAAQEEFFPKSAAELAAAEKAAALAEKKRQAEADKAAGKTKSSIFGSFFSKPATAVVAKEDPVLAALAQEEEEAESLAL